MVTRHLYRPDPPEPMHPRHGVEAFILLRALWFDKIMAEILAWPRDSDERREAK